MKKKAIVDKTAETQEALGLVNPMNHAIIGGYLNTVRTGTAMC